MKEPFYCRLQTVVLSQPCAVHAVICEWCRGLVLIRAVKWQRSVSTEADFTEWCTHWEGDYGRALAARWDANTKGGCEKHFHFTWLVISSTFSLCFLGLGWTAGSSKLTVCWSPTIGESPSGAWNCYFSLWWEYRVMRLDFRVYLHFKVGQFKLVKLKNDYELT